MLLELNRIGTNGPNAEPGVNLARALVYNRSGDLIASLAKEALQYPVSHAARAQRRRLRSSRGVAGRAAVQGRYELDRCQRDMAGRLSPSAACMDAASGF